ncbi:unnamed protein product [Pieris macdunnoughi]|uniref:Uncharacterized protein n=1 Tax=Pieris macdunnoughi TaxID=345717 RepID=A0A821VRN4_9NEOP|nr:unnamed protein product [Pieris macdunnoughi]
MKLEWTEGEDYGLEEAAFYEGPAMAAPPPRKHVSFSLRLDLCDEGGGNGDAIKTEPPEAEEPRTMRKVPSLSDLTDPETSLDKLSATFHITITPLKRNRFGVPRYSGVTLICVNAWQGWCQPQSPVRRNKRRHNLPYPANGSPAHR